MAYEMRTYQPGHFCEVTELVAKTGWAGGCEGFTAALNLRDARTRVKPVVRMRQIKRSLTISALHENLTKSAVLVQTDRMLLPRVAQTRPGHTYYRIDASLRLSGHSADPSVPSGHTSLRGGGRDDSSLEGAVQQAAVSQAFGAHRK
jgi:hypothetical protein